MSTFATKQPSKYWLIDSGCTHHMTHDRDLFKELNKSTVTKAIMLNGVHIAVEGIGTVGVKSHSGDKLISNVLYVPKLNQNLLSVPQLLKKGYKVLFEHEKCVIKDQNNKEVLRTKMKARKFILDLKKNVDIADEDEKKKEYNLKEDHNDACVLKKIVKGRIDDVGEKSPSFFMKVKNHFTAIKI